MEKQKWGGIYSVSRGKGAATKGYILLILLSFWYIYIYICNPINNQGNKRMKSKLC